MKPFDIELAKANHPVQTRDGNPVRIICWDRKDRKYPIVGLVTCKDTDHNNEEIEINYNYTVEGKTSVHGETRYDLFMAPNIKEGWVNIYPSKPLETLRKQVSEIYNSKEEALRYKFNGCIATTKIEWKE